MRSAKSASLSLRFHVCSLVKRKFFATCCVIVEAPTNFLLPPLIMFCALTSTARPTPGQSRPEC